MIVEKRSTTKHFRQWILFERKQTSSKRQWTSEKEQTKKLESLQRLHLIEIP